MSAGEDGALAEAPAGVSARSSKTGSSGSAQVLAVASLQSAEKVEKASAGGSARSSKTGSSASAKVLAVASDEQASAKSSAKSEGSASAKSAEAADDVSQLASSGVGEGPVVGDVEEEDEYEEGEEEEAAEDSASGEEVEDDDFDFGGEDEQEEAEESPEVTESSEVEDDSEEESEEAEGEEAAGEDEEDSEGESVGRDTITTVSNEVDVESDFDIHDVERQPAQVFPEYPWAGKSAQATKVAFACAFPLVLVFLVIYGTYKFFAISAQCFWDMFILLLKFIRLIIRLVLSPLLLLYHLLTPKYVKKQVDKVYEQHIGRRVRFIIRVKRFIVLFVLDIPFIILSCALSFIDTFVFPARDACKSCFWNYAGRHFFKHVMLPLFAAHLNRTAKAKRKYVDASRKDHDMRAMKLRNQKKARKRKKETHERARKLRQKKSGQVEVKLAIPGGMLDEEDEKVQVHDKSPTELLSRTMLIERRYAVAVGFAWSVAGCVMLVVLLDGQPAERCEICVQNAALGVMVCRHGMGRDCSFDLHRNEMIVGAAVAALGLIVMIYATFLYRPHTGAERAAEIERLQRIKDQEARIGPSNKIQDPDSAAIEIIHESLKERTVPRVVRLIFRHTPCGAMVKCGGHLANYPLKCIHRYEKRKALAPRSIKLTERFTAWVEKAIVDVAARDEEDAKKLQAHIEEHGMRAAQAHGLESVDVGKVHVTVATLKRGGTMLKPGARKKRSRFMAAVCRVCFPVVFFLERAAWIFSKTPCFPCFLRCLERRPALKRLCRSCATCITGSPDDPFARSSGKAGFGSLGEALSHGGPSVLEDVMERFGFEFDEPEEDEEEGEKKKRKPETEDERLARLKAEKPDPLGHVETLREAGGKDDMEDGADLEPTIAELDDTRHEDQLKALGVEGSDDGEDKPTAHDEGDDTEEEGEGKVETVGGEEGEEAVRSGGAEELAGEVVERQGSVVSGAGSAAKSESIAKSASGSQFSSAR